jgi:hypothetical protein
MFNVFAGPTRSYFMIPLELAGSSGCQLKRLHVGHTIGENTIALALAKLELGSWLVFLCCVLLSQLPMPVERRLYTLPFLRKLCKPRLWSGSVWYWGRFAGASGWIECLRCTRCWPGLHSSIQACCRTVLPTPGSKPKAASPTTIRPSGRPDRLDHVFPRLRSLIHRFRP